MSYDKQECMSALEESDEVFYAKMQKGLDDVRNGRITPLDDVYAELSKAISELRSRCRKIHQRIDEFIAKIHHRGVFLLYLLKPKNVAKHKARVAKRHTGWLFGGGILMGYLEKTLMWLALFLLTFAPFALKWRKSILYCSG